MKKLVALIFFLSCNLLFAQFPEGFEGSFPPPGWEIFRGENGLGDDEDWEITVQSNSGLQAARSRWEYVTSGDEAQDWLVTPQFTPQPPNLLTFYQKQSFSYDYGSIYKIYVSTASQTDHDDFILIETQDETDFTRSYTEKQIDLSAYEGTPIYVAFVHENNGDDNWFIDDVNFDFANPPVPCQTIVAELEDALPMPNSEGIILVCQQENITLNGAGQFSDTNGDNGATYHWEISDGRVFNGQSATFYFDTPGVYIANLKIIDASSNSCINTNQINQIIHVSTTPDISFDSGNIDQICYGDELIITASAQPTTSDCSPPINEILVLPDGSGESYSSEIEIFCYEDITITDVNDIEQICITMEHSYLGDLTIQIISPSGEILVLKNYLGTSGSGGSANLGEPWSAGPVDTQSTVLTPGVGYEYCFTPDPSSNTLLQGIQSGGIFDYADGPGTYEDSYVPEGAYAPDGDFSDLLNSTINGSWTILVIDNRGRDNGYIFDWNIDFDSSLIPTGYGFTPQIEQEFWSPESNIIETNGNSITVLPDSEGQHCYTYNVIDDFNCQYSEQFCIDVLPEIIYDEPEDLITCNPGGSPYLFDLTQNESVVFGTNPDPSAYELTFHNSQSDAEIYSNSEDTTVPASVTVHQGTDEKYPPIYIWWEYNYSQQIYYSSDIGSSGEITGFSLEWDGSQTETRPIVVYMAHTDKTNFDSSSDFIDISQFTEVYDGSLELTSTPGWVDITLDSGFDYDDSQNLVIAIDDNDGSYVFALDALFRSEITSNYQSIIKYRTTDIDPSSPAGFGNRYESVPNLKLSFETSNNPSNFISDPSNYSTPNINETIFIRISEVGSECFVTDSFDISAEGPAAPTGDPEQVFCDAATIADLTATGDYIQWYDAPSSGNLLNTSDILSDGQVVYASQTLDNCESTNRLEVIVTILNPEISASSTVSCPGESIDLSVSSQGIVFGRYSNWISGEPNNESNTIDPNGDENYGIARFPPNASVGWNDNPNAVGLRSLLEFNIPLNSLVNCEYLGDFNGHSYFLTLSGMTWQAANTFAVNNAGYLCIISSEDETEFLESVISGLDVNIGMYQDTTDPNYSEPDGGWKWVNETYVQMNDANAVLTEIEWYDGSTLIGTNETVTVNPSATTEYSVSIKINEVRCTESITLTVTAPVAPTTIDITQCDTGQTITATATADPAQTITWYDAATGGNIVSDPSLTGLGTATYYAEASDPNTGCVSATRTPAVLTINPTPVAPTTIDITECDIGQTITATATADSGQTITWYDAATGGSIVSDPSLTGLGTATYYAEASDPNTGCVSATRSAIVLTINPTPVAPTTIDITECDIDQTITATATADPAQTITWYDAATGGNIVSDPSLTGLGTVTYYAEASDSNTGCVSATRSAIVLTINPTPVAPTTIDITECDIGQTITATATADSGQTITWYDAATGGSIVSDPSLTGLGTVTYYAEASDSNTGCVSATRSAIVLTINPTPVAPTTIDITECDIGQTITATATAGSAQTITWYSAATGGNIVSDPSLTGVGSITYYAEASDSNTGCVSATRSAIVLTIGSIPAPTGAAIQTFCDSVTPAELLVTGTDIQWYDAATGGNLLNTSDILSDGQVVYASQTITGCESESRLQITVQVQTISPPTTSDITQCDNGQTITATATAGSAQTITWYSAATGGNIVSDPSLTGVGSITYYAEASDSNTGCVSATRSAIVLTIGSIPAPTGAAIQTFCDSVTPAELLVTGTDIQWYDAATGGNLLNTSDILSDGQVVYASQTITGCESESRLQITVQVQTISPPTTSDITQCDNGQTITATATADSGQTITWYDAATGGSIVSDPSLTGLGTATYYAEASDPNTGCVSATRSAIVLTINPTPVAPTTSDITECDIGQTITATATADPAQTITWYDAATGGNIVSDPSLTGLGTVTYYAEASDSNTGCVSATRSAIVLTIGSIPAPTGAAIQTFCDSVTPADLLVTGTDIQWYDAATGGNLLNTSDILSDGQVVYASQTITGCESESRLQITVQVQTISPPTTSDITQCDNGQTITATATADSGQTITWYDAATGGSIVSDPSLTGLGTVTYYAEASDSNTGCVSATRSAIVLTINPTPVAPTTIDITECDIGQTITATATADPAQTITWYDAATGGNIVSDPSLTGLGTVTYYAEASDSNTGCVSATRSAIVLTINPTPVAPTTIDITECDIGQTITATATAGSAQTITWYSAATGGNIVSDPSLTGVGSITYYAEASDSNTGCVSATRSAIVLTIGSIPAPTGAAIQTFCDSVTPAELLVTGTDIQWYDAATGGNLLNTSDILSDGQVVYASQTITGCESESRLQITVQVQTISPPTTSDITQCDNGQTITATATADSGQTITWYDAATGGSIVSDPSLTGLGTATYYAEASDPNTGCVSATRSAIVLTINPTPVAPTTSDITECDIGQTITATATADPAQTITWYSAATGGNIVSDPSLTGVGSITYYAEASDSNTGCVSATRSAIVLTIGSIPAPTGAAIQTFCDSVTPAELLVTGTDIQWYDAATGGNLLNTSDILSDGQVVYASQTITGCESESRLQITVQVQTISPPTTSDITQCDNGQTITATATADSGQTITWYSAATGGNIVSDPSLTGLGTATYYAEASDPNTGCVSATRSAIVLTIGSIPAPTGAAIQTFCDSVTPADLLVTGTDIQWYDAATGGNLLNTSDILSDGQVVYASQTITGCESESRLQITVQVQTISPPTTSDITQCDNGQTITATATADSGQTITWYDAATGGSIVNDPSLTGLGTATYYAEASDPNTGCISLIRSSLTLILSPFPYVEFDDNYLICNGSSGTVSNNVFVDSGLSASIYSFLWIDQLGTLISTDPILTTDVPGTYSLIVTDTNTNCSFQSETFSVNESSFPILIAEVSSAPFAGTQVIDATVTGTGIYEFSLDSGPWQADGNFTGVSAGEHIVRVRDINGCGEDFIDLIVLDFPRFFTPNGDGYNDFWNINALSGQPASKIYIFDRYGKLLKMIKPSGFGWDGTYNGNRMPTADYWFLLEYYDLTSGVPKQFRGHFTLKR